METKKMTFCDDLIDFMIADDDMCFDLCFDRDDGDVRQQVYNDILRDPTWPLIYLRDEVLDRDIENYTDDMINRAYGLLDRYQDLFCDLLDPAIVAAVTVTYRVWGLPGHRQRESFGDSLHFDFTDENGVRKIDVLRQDKTGTNDYVDVKITRPSETDCYDELMGQLTDGLFENSNYGKIERL